MSDDDDIGPVAKTLVGIYMQMNELARNSPGSREFGELNKEFNRIYNRASNLDQCRYHRAAAEAMRRKYP